MIVGIDETGDFNPNSGEYNYFTAVLIDQNKNKYNIKRSQFNIWESSIPDANRDKKGEAKGQRLTDEQLIDFYNCVLKPEPSLLYAVVRIIPNQNSKEILDKYHIIELKRIEDAWKMHKLYSKGNWAEWYERLFYWYKNREYAHLMKIKCLQQLMGMTFNHGIVWSQLTYMIDDQDTSNVSNFSFKIDKEFIRADNTKIIWEELLRQFWAQFSRENNTGIIDMGENYSNPVIEEYDLKVNKSELKKILRDRTFFLDSEDHFEIRMADIVGTIIHRFQNKNRCKEIYEEISKNLGGKHKNYCHLVLNNEI